MRVFLLVSLFLLLAGKSMAGPDPIRKVAQLIEANEWHLLRGYFEDPQQYEEFLGHFSVGYKKLSYRNPSSHLLVKGYKIVRIYDDAIELKEPGKMEVIRIRLSFTERGGRSLIAHYTVETPGGKHMRMNSGNASYIMLPAHGRDHPKYYASYLDHYLQNSATSVPERNVEFRQINFDNLNVTLRWCEKILGIQVCGNKTQTLEFGPVISKADAQGNEDFFRQITDLTAFSQSFSRTDYLEHDYIQTAVIVDKGLRQLVFMREGLLPWYYGSAPGEYAFQRPQAIKEIGGFLYVLDLGYMKPSVVVLKLSHTPDGNFQVQHIGTLDESSGVNLTEPTDIGGFTATGSNKLLVSDRNGIHVLGMDKLNGMPVVPLAYRVFYSVRDPLDLDYYYSLMSVNRLDASEHAENAVLITADNKIVSLPLYELDPANTNPYLTGNFVSQLSRDYLFTNLAYMVSEEKWYLTDYYGTLHNLSKNGRYIGYGCKEGTDEWNNELYEPIGITPNTITDPANPFRYRFIVANKWDETTGFKIFAPGLSITDARVFEETEEGSLHVTFTTSGTWQAVEHATGVTFSGIKINGTNVHPSVWNTQIEPGTPGHPGDELLAWPNVLVLDPQEQQIRRGWNTAELFITVFKSTGNELVSKKLDFYWLPSVYVPAGTSHGQAKINAYPEIDGSLVDFIYKPITIGNQGSFYSDDHKVVVSEEGRVTFQSGSTFYSRTSASTALANFIFWPGSVFELEENAHLCVSSGSSPSSEYHLPEISQVLGLDNDYVLGTNPPALPEYQNATCVSPCYYYDAAVPEVQLSVAVDYDSGPAFSVTANPAGTSYANRVRWEVEKYSGGSYINKQTAVVEGAASVVNLKALLSYTFEPCSEYRVTLSIACNETGWLASASRTFTTAPVVDAGADLRFCANDADTVLPGFSPAGGIWSGNGVSSSGLFEINSVSLNVAHTLTYTYTDVHGCIRADSRVVRVYAVPNPPGFSIPADICDKTPVFPVVFSGSNILQTHFRLYSPDDSLLSGISFPITFLVNITPEMAGTYKATATMNGCTSAPSFRTMAVRPLPEVDAGDAQAICHTDSVLTLTGHSPLGGIWSGDHVTSAGVFQNTGLAIGTYPVVYTYTDSYGCRDSVVKDVSVGPLVDAGPEQAFCSNQFIEALLSGQPAGGTWSGTDVVSGHSFDVNNAGTGSHAIIYTYEDTTGCAISDTTFAIVRDVQPHAVPEIQQSVVCEGEAVDIVAFPAIEEAEYIWEFPGRSVRTKANAISFAASEALEGDIYVRTEVEGCQGSNAPYISLVVHERPGSLSISGPATVCRQAGSLTYSVPFTSGSVYQWIVPAGAVLVSGQGSNSIVVHMGDTEGVISVTETNAAGCKGEPNTLPVVFYPTPEGATIYNPVEIGRLTACNTYTGQFNTATGCFGNDYDAAKGHSNGKISPDVFLRFELEYDSDVEISLCGSSFDTFLHLLDEAGNRLMSNDDHSICGASYPLYRMSYLRSNLVKGTYVIVCEGYSNLAGLVDIQVRNYAQRPGASLASPIALGILEPCQLVSSRTGNTPERCYGNTYAGSANQVSDDVFYSFILAQAGTVAISLCRSDFHTWLHVLDASHSVLASGALYWRLCMAERSSAELELGAGTYYIVAEGTDYQTGNVEVEVMLMDGSRPGASMTNPIVIGDLTHCRSYSDRQRNTFEQCFGNTYADQSSHDVFYKFSLSAPKTLRFSTCTSSLDTYIHLLMANGTRITYNNDHGNCEQSTGSLINTTSLAPGDYYLVVEGNALNTGEYELEISDTDSNCPQDCQRLYSSQTAFPENLGNYGSKTTYTGGGTFEGSYHVLGDIEFKEGHYTLRPGTVFYVEGAASGTNVTGSRITVGKNATLELNGATITAACEIMWYGIELDVRDPGTEGVEIYSHNNSAISNAQYGIVATVPSNPLDQPRMISGVPSDRYRLRVSNTRFYNNYQHIYLPRARSYYANNTISSNSFDCTPATMLSPRTGQYSSMGVYLWTHVGSEYQQYIIRNNDINHCGLGIVVQNSPGDENYLVDINGNTIENFYYSGIQGLTNTGGLLVRNNTVYVNALSAQSYNWSPAGNIFGIAVSGGIVSANNVIGNNVAAVSHQKFGIQAINAVHVQANEIERVKYGLFVNYDNIGVERNRVQNVETGLSLFNNVDYTYSVSCNTFVNTQLDNTTGIEIRTASPVAALGSASQGGANAFPGISTTVANNGLATGFTYYRYSIAEENVSAIGGATGGSVTIVTTSLTRDDLCSAPVSRRAPAVPDYQSVLTLSDLVTAEINELLQEVRKAFARGDYAVFQIILNELSVRELNADQLGQKEYFDVLGRINNLNSPASYRFTASDSLVLARLANSGMSIAWEACHMLKLYNLSCSCSDQAVSTAVIASKNAVSDAPAYAFLAQNTPNPAVDESMVSFFVPHTVQEAYMEINELHRGALMEKHRITGRGNGQVSISLVNYASGVYVYTLYLDGKPFDKKKMVIIR